MYRITSVAVGAVLAAIVSYVPAMAQSDSITVSAAAPGPSGAYQTKAASVSLAGIDLGSSQGAATLLDRLDVASRAVCGERAGVPMKAARAKLFDECRVRVVRYAVKDLNAPMLTQLAAVR